MNQVENLFLSVGAMKAGTTWVYDKLQYHPQIHFSKEKEIHYFSHVAGVAKLLELSKLKKRSKLSLVQAGKQFKSGNIKISEFKEIVDWYLNYAANPVNDEWYLSLFNHEDLINPEVYCADFSNLNCFLDEKGWRHVYRLAKNIKVIYILRDPIARLWSHYKFHLQFIGHKEQGNPEQNIHLFKSIINKPWFIRNSMYSDTIKNMKKYLKEDEFKVFYLEDISENPFEFFEQIHDFLGIGDFDYSFLDVHARKNTSISKDIPEDWTNLINETLGSECESLKKLNLWNEKWSY